MSFFKKLLKGFLKKGFRIGYSTGKPFDPRDHKRTDVIRDMIEKDNKRDEERRKKESEETKSR